MTDHITRHANCGCRETLRDRAAQALLTGMEATWGEAPTLVDARDLIDGVFNSAGVDDEAQHLRSELADMTAERDRMHKLAADSAHDRANLERKLDLTRDANERRVEEQDELAAALVRQRDNAIRERDELQTEMNRSRNQWVEARKELADQRDKQAEIAAYYRDGRNLGYQLTDMARAEQDKLRAELGRIAEICGDDQADPDHAVALVRRQEHENRKTIDRLIAERDQASRRAEAAETAPPKLCDCRRPSYQEVDIGE